ncbi:DUF6712 family protein [Flavobacterium panacagri]|uniref:DUF6712 family protein n=1 Tax=Flavobacterium panacagri TaxID=3034146 RepID=UPI0025A51B2F|nr:DUF6712 family protein [Flavobacterium panacagri]
MILETTADLKKYVSIAQSFEFDDFQPYIIKAVNTYTRKYLGNLHVFLKDEANSSETSFEIKNESREHLRNAISNFGMFMYFPFMSVIIDGSGASNTSNENRKPLEWWQNNDIRREFLRAGHEAMDLLLEVLENNPEVFEEWTEKFGTINNELLVKNTVSFDKYYNIFNSRQTFLALQPSIRQIEDQYLRTMLCPELIEGLKTEVTGITKRLKEELQKAIVAFTVAKVANEGLFLLDENGLRVSFQTAIDGKKESVSSGKTEVQLSKLVETQLNNGKEYLRSASQIIETNISEFTQCSSPLIKPELGISGSTIYDTNGVLSL